MSSLLLFVWVFAVSCLNLNVAGQLPQLDIGHEELAALVNELRAADGNRARPGQIQLDYQGHTGSADSEDRARKP
jgi:hypothetical protein